MNILCKPEAGLIIEANAINVLNGNSRRSTMCSQSTYLLRMVMVTKVIPESPVKSASIQIYWDQLPYILLMGLEITRAMGLICDFNIVRDLFCV